MCSDDILQISLDAGVEVEGSYWENMDRIIYNNGAIIYKNTDITETADIKFGTVTESGNINMLPEIDDETVTLDLLRSMNINS